VESIDKALSVYGTSVSQVVYHNLETEYKLPREKIPDDPRAFVSCIEKIFGSPSRTILDSITTSIDMTFNLPKSDTFAHAVRNAKVRLEEE